MRPGIEDLLRGSARILEEAVAPEVATPYAAEVLRGVIKNLRVLEQHWTRVLPFVLWDNQETAALLESGAAAAPPALGKQINLLLGVQAPDPSDFTAVHARNDTLRALLCELIAAAPPPAGEPAASARSSEPASALRADISSHLEARARRFPLRLVPDMPRAAAPKETLLAHLP